MRQLGRTPLLLAILEQAPVPVDWPKRVGYPPPGLTQLPGYPAGKGVSLRRAKKHKKHRHEDKSGPGFIAYDAEYPCTPDGKKIAHARAWQFPSKRVKICGKIIKT